MTTGIVLAGGRSSRLGRPKALACVGGEPIIVRVVRALRAVCDEIVVVANDPAIAQPLDAVRVVCDEMPYEGPLAGIASGLAAATTDPCVVVACDMPFIDPAVIARLTRLCDDVDAVVPRGPDGVPQPLHAVYRRTSETAIRSALSGGERRARAIVGLLEVRYHDEPDGRSWWNVNTPDDLQRAQASPTDRTVVNPR